MSARLCIVDYGIGNIRSIKNALLFLGYRAFCASDPAEFEAADGFILPGVGSFGEAMIAIEERNLAAALRERVKEDRSPFLGICLGAQLIAQKSYEDGCHTGLGWIDGTVRQIPKRDNMPWLHVGWNTVTRREETPLFDNIDDDANYYFDHRYSLCCDDALVTATTTYIEPLVAAIQADNIFATQFHPEKSQTNGLRLLRNFLNYLEDNVSRRPA